MKKPYVFIMNSVPSSENRYYGKIGGAKVHVWVMDETPESALTKAEEYVRRYQWDPREIEEAYQIQPERIQSSHKAELELYHTALQYGIAARFAAWQAEGHPDDPMFVLRPN